MRFSLFILNPEWDAVWAQTNNRKTWQLWHAGQTRFEHTRILKIFVAVWDCEWARGNRLTCFCIQIWDRNTDRLFTLQLSLVSLVQLHSLKWEALSLGIHFTMLTGREWLESSLNSDSTDCLCGPRSKHSWEWLKSRLLLSSSSEIFEAMQQ